MESSAQLFRLPARNVLRQVFFDYELLYLILPFLPIEHITKIICMRKNALGGVNG